MKIFLYVLLICNVSLAGSLIETGAVTNAKIGNNAVTSAKIADGTITSTDISSAAGIVSGQILDGTITSTDISSAAGIAYSQLNLNNSLVSGDLATGAVTTAKILDGTIVAGDLAASGASAGSYYGGFTVNSQGQVTSGVAQFNLALTSNITGKLHPSQGNVVGAFIETNGTVLSETTDFISGNCTNAAPPVCTFNASYWNGTPTCVASKDNSSNAWFISVVVASTTVTAGCHDNTPTFQACRIHIICTGLRN